LLCKLEALNFAEAKRHTPTEWRQIFAEALVPYAKIMGCAHFGTVRAASR
jgi:hypothetical protein